MKQKKADELSRFGCALVSPGEGRKVKESCNLQCNHLMSPFLLSNFSEHHTAPTCAHLVPGCWPASAGLWQPPPWQASLCRRWGSAWPAPRRFSAPARHGIAAGWNSAAPSRTSRDQSREERERNRGRNQWSKSQSAASSKYVQPVTEQTAVETQGWLELELTGNTKEI